MATIFGRNWTKRELLERVGDLAQVAGPDPFTYRDGVREGVRAVRLRTGGGLSFTVLPGRGMDISHAEFHGQPLGWISQTGEAHAHAFEPEERGWLRTFYGGLLTTCGLSNAGGHNTDDGEALGIHGRIAHIPAEEETIETRWDGDDCTFTVGGTLREARVFGENLRLTRRIRAKLGVNAIAIEDRVENVGFKTLPLMLLYHLNFGWPLVSETTEVVGDIRKTEPRDAVAETGIDRWSRFQTPTPGYEEQCFFHGVAADPNGIASVSLVNRMAGIGVRVDYTQATLPHLTQWKMMGQGEYVCGIEPANCRVFGRAAERAAGRLQTIAPGETRTFGVTLTVLDGDAAR